MNDDIPFRLPPFVGFIFGVFFIFALFELIILGVAFFGADEIECNFLWCEFTTTRTNQNDSIIIETHRNCFLNGFEIDCNDNRTDLDRVITSGNFDSEPIFKYDKRWRDILE